MSTWTCLLLRKHRKWKVDSSALIQQQPTPKKGAYPQKGQSTVPKQGNYQAHPQTAMVITYASILGRMNNHVLVPYPLFLRVLTPQPNTTMPIVWHIAAASRHADPCPDGASARRAGDADERGQLAEPDAGEVSRAGLFNGTPSLQAPQTSDIGGNQRARKKMGLSVLREIL